MSSESCLIPLRSKGLFAIIDVKYKPLIEKEVWYLRKGVGVYCRDGKSLILLHNMIAPYAYVSFKNGNKLDCRRENLVEFKNNDFVKTRVGENIGHNKEKKFYSVHRGVKVNGSKYRFDTSYSYKTKPQERALEKCKEWRDFLFSMTRQEFVEWRKQRPDHRVSYNEIVSQFDSFNGEEISRSELIESGMSHVY